MPNASIPTPEPVKQRKMFGAYGKAVGTHSVAFISQVRVSTICYLLSKVCYFRFIGVLNSFNPMFLRWTLPSLHLDTSLLRMGVLVKNQEQNGKQCISSSVYTVCICLGLRS